MKFSLVSAKVCGTLLAFSLIGVGCGGEDALLTISPAGPTVVQKGETLQFSASRDGVTWTVDGGAANGSIDSSGLYTPPATLPVGDPEINVLAAEGGDTAAAVVSLRTSEVLTLGSEASVSQSVSATVEDFGLGFMGNRLAVGLGSIHEMSVFSGENAGTPNLFLTQALDLGNFLTPVNLTNDSTISDLSSAIEIDSQLNPHILFARGDFSAGPRLMMVSSSDQGQSFGAPVPLAENADTDVSQIMGFLAMDGDESLHVAFASLNSMDNSGAILYTRSEDGGATWISPVTVQSAADELIFPALAVSPDGNNVYIAYFDGSGPSISFAKSSDGGATFGSSVPLSAVNPSGVPPFSKVALDPEGNVYVSFSEETEDNGTIKAVLRRSNDGGASFGEAVRISSAPAAANEIFANIAIDDLGRIDAIWSSDIDGNQTYEDLEYARSVDGGATFSAAETVAVAETDAFVITRALRHDESGRLYMQYMSAVDFMTGGGEIFTRRAE